MTDGASPIERMKRLPPGKQDRAVRRLAGLAAEGASDWAVLSRQNQVEPPGDWRTWLILAGRGFGKTRAGAEWVQGRAAMNGRLRIALVGASAAEARAVMVEGESGILAVATPGHRPRWEPSLGLLVWPSGARAMLYSAEAPERLRGPQHHIAWCDEIAKWPHGARVWDNLQLGLRLGRRPQVVATTTPRPVALLKRIKAAPGTVETRGRTRDNAANLPEIFLRQVEALYGGTRLGRQELDGELIEEIEGALWTRDLIEQCRVRDVPGLRRVVIGVDPPAGTQGDACGIVAAGLGADGIGYVLADASVAGLGPEGWARAVAGAAAAHKADKVIAEVNNGGAMVTSVLRAVDPDLPVKAVHAAHGKVARAEPVAALYAAGKVRHAGGFSGLEDEMCGLIAGGGYAGPGRSPDRADALVWALTELMLGGRKREPRVRVV